MPGIVTRDGADGAARLELFPTVKDTVLHNPVALDTKTWLKFISDERRAASTRIIHMDMHMRMHMHMDMDMDMDTDMDMDMDMDVDMDMHMHMELDSRPPRGAWRDGLLRRRGRLTI